MQIHGKIECYDIWIFYLFSKNVIKIYNLKVDFVQKYKFVNHVKNSEYIKFRETLSNFKKHNK